MIDGSMRAFIERLASTAPAPGGGSAAALAGAMAAGLTAMVARLSLGRGSDDEALDQSIRAAEALDQTIRTADQAAATLLALVDRDAEAFGRVIGAYGLPRGSDQEKKDRRAAIQDALRNAAAIPLTTAEQAVLVLALMPDLARAGNPNAISDVGVAAVLAHAAVRGALLNVAINVKSITEAAYRDAATVRMDELRRRADELRAAAMDLVEATLA
ncbi:MAG: cyclodeaminase/cyclohydrolase family protein [bacterium]